MPVSSINTSCPFSGKPVQDNSITEIDNVKIGFCNPGCRDKFAANPENYPQVLGEFLPQGRLNTYDGASFLAQNDWGNKHIANINGTSVKIHSSKTPYKWHTNNGQEVFVVLDGEVEMRYQRDGETYKTAYLRTGMITHMESGCEHVAHPVGLARMLVIEQLGSV